MDVAEPSLADFKLKNQYIYCLYDMGLDVKTIAHKADTTPQSVRGALSRIGAKSARPRAAVNIKSSRTIMRNDEELRHRFSEMYNAGAARSEIQRRLGLTPSTYRNLRIAWDLPDRRPLLVERGSVILSSSISLSTSYRIEKEARDLGIKKGTLLRRILEERFGP
jgi:hypothetical protein